VYIQYNVVQCSTCMVSYSVQQLFVRPSTSDSARWYSCTVKHCSRVHCPHSAVYETRWICQLSYSQCGEYMCVFAMAQNSAQSAHTYTKALHGKQCDFQRKLWCTHVLALQSIVTAVTRHHSATRASSQQPSNGGITKHVLQELSVQCTHRVTETDSMMHYLP
jgi:hypothetical protein